MRIRVTARSVEALTGSRTRVVWVDDHGDLRDYQARGTNRMLRLMGYDSRDGRGVRPILEELSNYAKPMLTPSGRQVVFSDFQNRQVSVVDFDGGNRRRLTSGMGLDVWRDPATGIEWVYIGRDRLDRRGYPYAGVYRFPLEQPDNLEEVWDRRPVGLDNFQLSADGRWASGVFPWPDAGVADLAEGTWTRLGNGCWPSLAPDHSGLFWVFHGNHRVITMWSGDRKRRWEVRLNTSPTTDGHEIYHPRWSNDPRILAITGPYKNRVGHSYTRGGGPDVEIHLGRFSEDFSEIEAWVQVTDSPQASFLPDVWVEAAASGLAPPAAREAPAVGDERMAAASPSTEGLVFIWDNRSRNNEIEEEAGGRVVACRVEPEGQARYGRHHEMDVRRGRFVAEDSGDWLNERFRARPEVSMEAWLTARSAPGLVMGLSSGPDRRHLALIQEDGHLHVEVRFTREAGEQSGRWELFTLPDFEPVHVVVTIGRGEIRGYRNGELAIAHVVAPGDFGDWPPVPLVFGSDIAGESGWSGLIEGVAIYNRVLSPEEVVAGYEATRQPIAERRAPAQAVVQARLAGSTPVPAPGDIEPYRRALLVNEYDVLNVERGELAEARILVAHWAIMDDRVLEAAQRAPGEIYRMTLEAFGDRPELEGEWMALGDTDPLLPLYVDIAE